MFQISVKSCSLQVVLHIRNHLNYLDQQDTMEIPCCYQLYEEPGDGLVGLFHDHETSEGRTNKSLVLRWKFVRLKPECPLVESTYLQTFQPLHSATNRESNHQARHRAP